MFYSICNCKNLIPLGFLFMSCAAWSEQALKDTQDVFDLSLEELMDVVVTPSKQDQQITKAPGVITVITREEFSKLPAQTLGDLVELLPSTLLQSTFFIWEGSLGVRGDNSEHFNKHVLMLMDGRPISDSLFGGLDTSLFNTYPVSSIDRIEFIRGPGSVLYGTGAYFGVINIISTKKPMQSASVGGGNLDTFGGTYGFQQTMDGGDYGIHLTARNTNGWDFTAIDNLGVQNTLGIKQEDYGLKANVNKDAWTYSAFAGKTRIPYLGRGNNWVNTTTADSWRLFQSIGYEQKWNDAARSQLNFIYNELGLDDHLGGDLFSARAHEYTFSDTNYYRYSDQLKFLVGLGGTINMGEWKSSEEVSIPFYNEKRYRVFSEASYTFSDQLSFVLGVQGNKVPMLDWNISPRLAAIFNVDPHYGVKASYGEAFRSATAQERFVNQPGRNLGNDLLEPEIIKTTDLHFYYRKDNLIGGLTFFYSQEEALIGRAVISAPGVGPVVTQQQNLGGLDTQGVEFELQWAGDKWSTLGSIGLFDSESETGEDNPKNSPELLLKIGGAYQLTNDLEFSLMEKYIDKGKPINNDLPNPPVENVHLLSSKLTYDFGQRLALGSLENVKLEFSGDNLLDEEVNIPEFVFERVNSIPGRAGRTYFLNLVADF